MQDKKAAFSFDATHAHRPLDRFDVPALAADVKPWFNRSLVTVNDCLMRYAVVEGVFHWHHHDQEDELFYCVEGQLLVDLEPNGDSAGRTVTLDPGQGIMIPRGVEHRTRAPGRTVIMMFSGAGVAPTGDR